jgi:hypothetical protein
MATRKEIKEHVREIPPDEFYPWEKLPREPLKAYEAFCIFIRLRTDVPRDDPNYRSRRNVMRILGHKAPRTVQDWSSRYYWTRRTEVLEEWRTKKIMEADTQMRKRARLRHLKLAQDVQEVGMKRLHDIKEEIERTGHAPEIDMLSLSKLISEAVKLERLILDEPTENTRTNAAPAQRVIIIMPDTSAQGGDDGEKEADVI